MKTLYICKGLPASGKTTWAKQIQNARPNSIKRINKDDLRAMLDNGHWSHDAENFVLYTRDTLVKNALADGKHVIVDDTNFAPKHEKRLRELAKFCGANVEIVDFTEVPVEECIRRDKGRPNPVGEKVIRDMYEKYLAPKPAPVKWNPDLPTCIIVDIDGTVAKMNGRGPFEWDKVDTDVVNEPVAEIVRLFDEEYCLVFVSGRDECCREKTTAFIKGPVLKNRGSGGWLYMRPAGDNRDDRIIKREIYEQHIKGKYNVRFVLDDRDKVVRMWRELGLPCFQVAPGNF